MQLAREFGRADWRVMLAGMSSSEYGDWVAYYRTHYFQDVLLDAEFSALSAMIANLACRSDEFTPQGFSLLNPVYEDEQQDEMSDTELMLAASGMGGGVRYGISTDNS